MSARSRRAAKLILALLLAGVGGVCLWYDGADSSVVTAGAARDLPARREGREPRGSAPAEERVLADVRRAPAPPAPAANRATVEQQKVARLVAEYRSLGASINMDRFLVVRDLGRLASPHAYELLRDIAFTPPLPREPGEHHNPRADYELYLRQEATDVLAKLARNGHAGARADLLTMASDPRFEAQRSVRIRAIRGYVSTQPSEEELEELTATLPLDEHFALEPPDADPTES